MNAVIEGQLDLFDVLEQIEEEERLTCPCCGRAEGNDFLLSLNHGIRYDAEGKRINPTVTVCIAMWLTRNHALATFRYLDAANRSDDQKCFNHPSARKPCPQGHFDEEHDVCAARADQLWGDRDWREWVRGPLS